MPLELEVQRRDKHGQPMIIKLVQIPEDGPLVIENNKKLPKKRLRERHQLWHRNQRRLQDLVLVPKELEWAQEERKRAEGEFGKQLPKEKPIPSGPEIPLIPSVPPPPVKSTKSHYLDIVLLYGQVGLCVVFFAMALFPSLRSHFMREINESISRHIYETTWMMNKWFTENLPLTTSIIKSLYGALGFWPVVAGAGLGLYAMWDLIQIMEVARGALSRRAKEIAMNMIKSKK